MNIHPEQLEALGASRAKGFIARVVDFVREELPEFARRGDTPQLTRVVEYAQERAATYGFVSEQHIVCFIVLMVTLGPRFDEDERHAAAHRLLRDTQAPAGLRMEFLLEMAAAAQPVSR